MKGAEWAEKDHEMSDLLAEGFNTVGAWVAPKEILWEEPLSKEGRLRKKRRKGEWAPVELELVRRDAERLAAAEAAAQILIECLGERACKVLNNSGLLRVGDLLRLHLAAQQPIDSGPCEVICPAQRDAVERATVPGEAFGDETVVKNALDELVEPVLGDRDSPSVGSARSPGSRPTTAGAIGTS